MWLLAYPKIRSTKAAFWRRGHARTTAFWQRAGHDGVLVGSGADLEGESAWVPVGESGGLGFHSARSW